MQKQAGAEMQTHSSKTLKDNTPIPLRNVLGAMSGNQMRNISVSERDKMIHMIEAFTVDLGKKEPLDFVELKRLIEHIKREFASLTLLEVEQSFSLYLACKLDFKNERFQGINKLFLGNVLGSYRRYKTSQLAKRQAYERDNAPPVDETIRARAAHNATVTDLYTKLQESIKARKCLLKDDHGMYYDLVTKAELFQPAKTKKALAYKSAKKSILEIGLTHNEAVDPRKASQFKHFREVNTNPHNTYHIRAMHFSKAILFEEWINQCIEIDYDFKFELENILL